MLDIYLQVASLLVKALFVVTRLFCSSDAWTYPPTRRSRSKLHF